MQDNQTLPAKQDSPNLPGHSQGIKDADLLRLYAKGYKYQQMADILHCSLPNVKERMRNLLPKGKVDEVLMSLSKGKALQALAAISEDKLDKAGLGEIANAAKRLIDINQVVSGKDTGKTLNININIGPGNHLVKDIIEVQSND